MFGGTARQHAEKRNTAGRVCLVITLLACDKTQGKVTLNFPIIYR
jgi:hypothetical protein